MRAFCSFLAGFILLLVLNTGCTHEVEEFKTDLPSDYVPLQVGKYIIYRIDSTVFTQAGRAEETHSYLEKDVVDAKITDNQGRTSYRIYRFLNNLTGQGTWVANGSYLITPLEHSVEVVENNMRSLKLVSPIRQDAEWKGNRFIIDEPYYPTYDFTAPDNRYPSDWNFVIKEINGSLVLNNKSLTNVVTVLLVDEKNLPDTLNVTSNTLNIPSTSSLSFWLKGSATDTVRLTAPIVMDSSARLNIYNATNKPLSLNNIPIPINFSRSYQSVQGKPWSYPLVKTKVVNTNRDTLIARDTLYSDLPYGIKSYAVDKYSKNIGLVYQELALWEYQPNPGGTPYKIGFAIKRSMVDHN
jgi:hypothetical protein